MLAYINALVTPLLELGLVALVNTLALWRKDVIFYIVAGLITTFVALSWIPDYPQISVPLLGLGLYQIGQGILSAMGTSPSKGVSQFKVLLGRVKGWF